MKKESIFNHGVFDAFINTFERNYKQKDELNLS